LFTTRCSTRETLPHRRVFEIDGPVGSPTIDEFGDEGASNIVLLDDAERSGN
jgi:hypothetical protein